MRTFFLARQLLPAITATAGLLLSTSAHAAFVFDYSGAFINQTSGSYILGDNFQVNSAIQVTQLGVFSQDAEADTSIPIGIFQHTGNVADSGWKLVAGTSANISTFDTTDAGSQTRFIDIAPVVLGPGLYSVVTATATDYNSGNPNLGTSAVGFNNLGGAVSLAGFDIWNNYIGGGLGTTLDNMGTTGPGDPQYPWPEPVFGAGTFSATPVVPEASTVVAGLLLLLPFGASALRSLRRNHAA